MKQFSITMFSLLCLFCAVGQSQPEQDVCLNANRDYKSSLNLSATLTSFAVSPSGEIWLSVNYSLWHTHGMSSNWKRVPHSKSYAVDFSHVVCPDTNTVLVFGRMFDPSDPESRYNKYMRSTDGGKSWKFLPMPRKMKRHETWAEGRVGGKVWLCIDSVLYYSSDKGLHFQEIATIPGEFFKFDMDDNGYDGIRWYRWKDSASVSKYGLLITRDNWAHYEIIPTPYDQHPEIKSNYFHSSLVCHSKLVLKQNDRCYWTPIDTICWREIPLNIRDIAADRESNEWVIVTRENCLLRSTDLLTFDTVNTNGPCYFTTIKYADSQAIYGFSSTPPTTSS